MGSGRWPGRQTSRLQELRKGRSLSDSRQVPPRNDRSPPSETDTLAACLAQAALTLSPQPEHASHRICEASPTWPRPVASAVRAKLSTVTQSGAANVEGSGLEPLLQQGGNFGGKHCDNQAALHVLIAHSSARSSICQWVAGTILEHLLWACSNLVRGPVRGGIPGLDAYGTVLAVEARGKW